MDNIIAPLNLAYMGDAVFEVLVRDMVVRQCGGNVNRLHRESRAYVNAAAQARMYFKIWPLLTEEERHIMKRGRNAKSAGKPKNMSVSDYRHATGLETLFGFLHIMGKNERLLHIFEMCVAPEAEHDKK